MHIESKIASRRSPISDDQAQLFAILTRDLMQAYGRYRNIALEKFFQLPEYGKFVLGAHACKFVCHDYPLMDGARFDLLQSQPRGHLDSCTFRTLRHWVHMLLRAERWADGYSSPVREALDSGALEIMATRLESDHSLREPEVTIALKEASVPAAREN